MANVRATVVLHSIAFVRETACVLDGGACCELQMSWDAGRAAASAA